MEYSNKKMYSFCKLCPSYLLLFYFTHPHHHAGLHLLAWPLAVAFHHSYWPLSKQLSDIPALVPFIGFLVAALRNSTAYQHFFDATFYRCICCGCTQVPRLRRYNRLVAHVSISRCGGSAGQRWAHKRESWCPDRKCVICQTSVTDVNRCL